MINYCVLGSGSKKGNAAIVSANKVQLLIDAGLSCRQIEQRLQSQSIDPNALAGVFLTHEHSDHINGLSLFCQKYHLPVFANEGTATAVEYRLRADQKTVPEFVIFQSGVPFELDDLVITPVRTSHDVAESVGYTFALGEIKLGYFTDLGIVTQAVGAALAGCQGLVFESNHDCEMLRCSGRAWPLVARILGEVGHLSNEQSCQAIAQYATDALQHLTLAHLSSDCNEPALAHRLMAETLKLSGHTAVSLDVATQDCVTPMITLA